MKQFLYKSDTFKIIGACMEVHKTLGHGFAEQVYQEAITYEFNYRDISYLREAPIKITYKDMTLDKMYIADFICLDNIVLEIKAVNQLSSAHFSQVLNYLKATDKKVGLLINFGAESLEYKRIVL
jgi:GxxExxY protein